MVNIIYPQSKFRTTKNYHLYFNIAVTWVCNVIFLHFPFKNLPLLKLLRIIALYPLSLLSTLPAHITDSHASHLCKPVTVLLLQWHFLWRELEQHSVSSPWMLWENQERCLRSWWSFRCWWLLIYHSWKRRHLPVVNKQI